MHNKLIDLQVNYDAFRNPQSAALILGAPRLNDTDYNSQDKVKSMDHIIDLLLPQSEARARGYKVTIIFVECVLSGTCMESSRVTNNQLDGGKYEN